MVHKPGDNKAHDNLVEIQQHPPDFDKVSWTKDPAIRKLYIYCTFGLLVGSATTGYDGSLLNEIQNYNAWEDYFDGIGESGVSAHKASLLGLLTNMFTIGSIISMFVM